MKLHEDIIFYIYKYLYIYKEYELRLINKYYNKLYYIKNNKN